MLGGRKLGLAAGAFGVCGGHGRVADGKIAGGVHAEPAGPSIPAGLIDRDGRR